MDGDGGGGVGLGGGGEVLELPEVVTLLNKHDQC